MWPWWGWSCQGVEPWGRCGPATPRLPCLTWRLGAGLPTPLPLQRWGADAPRVPCSSRSASRSTSKGPRAAHPSDRQLAGALVRVLLPLPLPLGRERRPGTQPRGTAPGSQQRAASSPRLIPLASLWRRKTCRKCKERSAPPAQLGSREKVPALWAKERQKLHPQTPDAQPSRLQVTARPPPRRSMPWQGHIPD